MTTIFESLVPLSDIEDVLAWVDTFKLTRATKKINRDFSDAVLLAEILVVHYPKLVEMHNYPPRNSHALKLNNWMTLNRKVLKKLKLHLCSNTMEQLANSASGVIERVLIMVRDKIRRDAEANKEAKENEQNLSSGGEYFEAGGDDDQVLVVPLKMRVNGILETIQQRVVSHESYLGLKEELRDAKETADLMKQRVEHLDNLLKLKDERIEELQKQLDRKASRRHEVGAQFYGDTSQPLSIKSSDVMIPLKVPSIRSLDSSTTTPLPIPVVEELSNISVPITPDETPKISATKIEHEPKPSVAKMDLQAKLSTPKISATKMEHEPNPSVAKMDLQAKLSTPKISATKMEHEPKLSVAKMDLQAKLSTPKISATKMEHEPNPSVDKMDLQAKLSTPKISATKMEHEPNPSVAKMKLQAKLSIPKISAIKMEHEPNSSVAKMDLQVKLSTDKVVMPTNVSAIRIEVQPKIIPLNAEVNGDKDSVDLDRVRSDVFQEAELVQEKRYPTDEEFKDSFQDLTMNGPSVKDVVAISNEYGVPAVIDMDRMRLLNSLRRMKEEKTQELKKLLDRKGTLCNVNVGNNLPAQSDVVVSALPSTKFNSSLKISNSVDISKISMPKLEDSSSSKIPVPRKSSTSIIEVQPKVSVNVSASKQMPNKRSTSIIEIQPKLSADNIVIQNNSATTRIEVKPKLSNTSNDAEVNLEDDDVDDLDRVRSDVFKEAAEAVMEDGANAEDDKKNEEYIQMVPSIGRTITQEIIDITNHLGFKDTSYVN